MVWEAVKVGENRYRERGGRYFEDFKVGDIYEHRPGRTITETDLVNFISCTGMLEAIFIESGYAGGLTKAPTYRQVCNGDTNHAEVVEVTFDPAKVDYGTLVDLFFRMHNPTTRNRQGPDVGTQYRSVIFTHGPEQERIAEERKQAVDASGKWKTPVVTQIEPAPTFWKAEEHH